MKIIKIYKAPLLSGVLFGCSFIPFPFFTLFFALVPLWFFIYQQSSLKRVLIGCFLCQFITTLIGFNWMIYTFHNFGGMNWFLSFIFLIGFCVIVNLYMICSGALWFILTKKSSFPLPVSVKLILLPLIFSLLHSLIPTVFPWNMGYPWLWGNLPGAQTAELWGFRFLNTMFYIFNFLFLVLYKHCGFNIGQKNLRKKNKFVLLHFADQIFYTFKLLFSIRFDKIGIRILAGAIVLFLFLNGLGFYLKQRLPQPNQFLNVIVVQNNIGSIAHLDPKPFRSAKQKSLYASQTLTYKAFFKYSKKKKKREKIDFILWTEGAYGYSIRKKAKKERRLSKMVKLIQTPLVTGALSKENGEYGNSLFVFDRQGNILQPVYDKIKLLAFGEYFPGIDRFPFLRKIFPYFGANMTPGKGIQVQELEGRRFGWQICYESLFDQISRNLAKKQAQVLVNITNDSWYGSWQEPYQHLTMNFARAIEVRRPLIRATNTGYSGVIRADGTIDKISPLNKTWFHLYKVPYYEKPPTTLFMSWGYYINEIFLLLLALLAATLSFKSWPDSN